jgi:hypothetical protein
MTPRISIWRAGGGSIAALAMAAAVMAPVANAASVTTDHRCYLVGQKVMLTGSGFAASRSYVVSVDDVYYGMSSTDSNGDFSVRFGPGGLGANVAQAVDQLVATDGTSSASTTFTVTRSTGARFLATKGNPATLKAPFELWDFSATGARRALYLHWVAPSGGVRETMLLGHTTGECGYLKTKPTRVFPFRPTLGSWTLQIDTQRKYARRPAGPVARILVGIA